MPASTIQTIPPESVEYIKVPVKITEEGRIVDPRTFAVKMAVKPVGTRPSTGDFKTAEWEVGGPQIYYSRVRVGTGTLVGALTIGMYRVWVQVTTADEAVVRDAGPLRVE